MKYFGIDKTINPKILISGFISKYNGNHITRITDFYELFLVEEGDLYLQQDDIKYHLKRGDLFIASPRSSFGGYKKSKCSFFFLHFEDNGYINIYKENIKDTLPIKISTNFYSELEIILQEINAYHRESNTEEIISSLINSLFAIIKFKLNEPTIPITNNKDFNKIIEDILFSPELNGINSISNIAKKYNYNSHYLSSLFKKYFKMNFITFLAKVKIDKCKRMLLSTDYKIKEIAAIMGYKNDYFVKFFKSQTGITPTEFRQGLTAKTEEFIRDANFVFVKQYKK